MPALIAAGIEVPKVGETIHVSYSEEECQQILGLAHKVRTVLVEQSSGWKQRSVFEQQWLIRSFKKYAGMTAEEWLEILDRLEQAAATRSGDSLVAIRAPLGGLASYHAYMHEMAKGYIKDPVQREQQLAILLGWQVDAEELGKLLKKIK
jgi:hypothetical protein